MYTIYNIFKETSILGPIMLETEVNAMVYSERIIEISLHSVSWRI